MNAKNRKPPTVQSYYRDRPYGPKGFKVEMAKRKAASARAVAYYYRAYSDDEDDDRECSEFERSLFWTAKKHGLSLGAIWPDGQTRRPNRVRALGAIREGQASVLIVPSLRHLSHKPAVLVELVDEAFSGFKAARLLTCDGEFDSDKPAARACWPILRAVTEFESELGYQLKGVTVH